MRLTAKFVAFLLLAIIFIESNGAATVAELKRATGHKEATVNQAIGWLAREGKIAGESGGRTTRWSLAQC